MSDQEPDIDSELGGPEGDMPMSFFDHIAELRGRLIRAALAIVIGFAVSMFFVRELQDLLLLPLQNAWTSLEMEGAPTLQNLGVLDHFLTHVRIAITAGIFLSAPMAFYQLWMFVSPGLYNREKRFAVPFMATSAIMFASGAVFCYFMVLPFATQWFLGYSLGEPLAGGVEVISQYRFPDYIKYTTKLLIGFGIMFEFPLLVLFLAAAGVLTHRTLLRHWKISVLLIFIASAFLTPPDPITLTLMAVPMVGLFFASVGVAYVFSRHAAAESGAAED